MATAAIPTSVRDRIWAIIARTVPGEIQAERRLEDVGTAVTVDLVLAMEQAFHILIDMDEVLPDGTFGSLAALTELRIRAHGVRPMPTEPAQLIDLAAARADRARRARDEEPAPMPAARAPDPIYHHDAMRWRRIISLFVGTSLAAGAFAGLAFLAIKAGWSS